MTQERMNEIVELTHARFADVELTGEQMMAKVKDMDDLDLSDKIYMTWYMSSTLTANAILENLDDALNTGGETE